MDAAFTLENTITPPGGGETMEASSMVKLSGGGVLLVGAYGIYLRQTDGTWITKVTQPNLPWDTIASFHAFESKTNIGYGGADGSVGDVVIFAGSASFPTSGNTAYYFVLSAADAASSDPVDASAFVVKNVNYFSMIELFTISQTDSGKIYMYGGRTVPGGVMEVEVNVSTDWRTWDTTASTNFPDYYAEGLIEALPAVAGEFMYFVGGSSGSYSYGDTVTIAGLDSGSYNFLWQGELGSFFTSRSRFIFNSDNELVCIGGTKGGVYVIHPNLLDGAPMSTVNVYTYSSSFAVTAVNDVPSLFSAEATRDFPSAVLLDDGKILVASGGADALSVYTMELGVTGSGGGDPYVVPLLTGARLKLPVLKAAYRMYGTSRVVANASVCVMSHTKAYASVDMDAARELVRTMIRRGQSLSALDELSFFEAFAFMDIMSGDHVVVEADTGKVLSQGGSAFSITPFAKSVRHSGVAGGDTICFERTIYHPMTKSTFVVSVFPSAPLLRSAIALGRMMDVPRDATGLLLDPMRFSPRNRFGRVKRLRHVGPPLRIDPASSPSPSPSSTTTEFSDIYTVVKK